MSNQHTLSIGRRSGETVRCQDGLSLERDEEVPTVFDGVVEVR